MEWIGVVLSGLMLFLVLAGGAYLVAQDMKASKEAKVKLDQAKADLEKAVKELEAIRDRVCNR